MFHFIVYQSTPLVSRKQVTERAGLPIPKDGATTAELAEAERETSSTGSGSSHTLLWAMLLARIYEVFLLICTNCGGKMRNIAFITEAAPIRLNPAPHRGTPSGT